MGDGAVCGVEHSTNVEGSTCSLTQELERVEREKRELRAQYAREIEAAHSQLGEKEAELGAKHVMALQDWQDRHKKGDLYTSTHVH